MANVIKYIYTSVPVNTVKTYPFVIGVNFGGYGSTAATGYWNGKTPNVGGYTIYVETGAGSPTLYVADNDTQLINLCNQLFGTSVSTVGAALQTFNGSTSTCCVNVDYSNIVTSGLVLNLDAGYTPSYPRTGTSWTDLSGSGYTGTLINGPTYSSDGGGCIVSDGSDDGVTFPDSSVLDISGSFTLDGWVWFNQHKDFGSLLVKGPGGAGQLFNYCFFFYASSLVCGFGDGSNFYSAGVLTTPNVPINTWHHIVGVYNSVAISFYLNGVLIQSNPIVATPYQNTNNLNIIQSDYPIDGKVISAKVYNRALSATEILQNYYAGLQRFIPTNGLVLYLDGNNTNKQVMTASTANDISGNNNNGTLMNGVTLVRDGQRSFSFDGTNDYIDLGSSTLLSTATTNITVSIWFKYTTTPPTGYTLIKFGGSSAGWLLGFSSGGFYYNLYTTTYTYFGGGISLPSVNVWSNLTFTFNGTTFIMYLNGAAVVNTPSSSGTITNGGSNLINIGRDGSGNTNFFTGNISVVRGYNQTLTAAQVLTIYNAGKGRYGL
jgi:hypothetical protein